MAGGDESDSSELSSVSDLEQRWALQRASSPASAISPTPPLSSSTSSARALPAKGRVTRARKSKSDGTALARKGKDKLAGGLAALLSSTNSRETRSRHIIQQDKTAVPASPPLSKAILRKRRQSAEQTEQEDEAQEDDRSDNEEAKDIAIGLSQTMGAIRARELRAQKKARQERKRERSEEQKRDKKRRKKEKKAANLLAASSAASPSGPPTSMESVPAIKKPITRQSAPAGHEYLALPSFLKAGSRGYAVQAVERSLEMDAIGGGFETGQRQQAKAIETIENKKQKVKRGRPTNASRVLASASSTAPLVPRRLDAESASGRVRKPTKRFVDEMDEAQLAQSLKKAKKTPAPASTSNVPSAASSASLQRLIDPYAATSCPPSSRPAVPFAPSDFSLSSAPRPAPQRPSTIVQQSLSVHSSLLPENLPPIFTLPKVPHQPGVSRLDTSFLTSAPLVPRPAPVSSQPTPALPPKKPRARPPKPSTTPSTLSSSSSSSKRALHPALLSRASWVECAKNLTLTEQGRPPIWCQGRQELCESAEWFKSYQGGHYDLQERCLGYLLDGFPSANDRCEDQGRIIISHGGGCSEATPSSFSSIDPVTGRPAYRLKADQTRSNLRMRALQNCLDHKTPVVLIAGKHWEFFPALGGMGAPERVEIDEEDRTRAGKKEKGKRKQEEEKGETRYGVLGHYWVTDIWAEGEPVSLEDGRQKVKGKDKAKVQEATAEGKGELEEEKEFHVRFKVRFEWVAAQGKPWFADVIGSNGLSSEASSVFPVSTCSAASATAKEGADAPTLPSTLSSPSTSTSSLFESASSSETIDSSVQDAMEGAENGQCEEREEEVIETVTCQTCEQTHRMIYRETIGCYNETCERFFLLDGVMPSPAKLTYCPSLLSPTCSRLNDPLYSSSLVPETLVPASLQSLAGTTRISDYSFLAWRGFHCSACGRLSSRSEWDRLRCAGCGLEAHTSGRVFSAEDLTPLGQGQKTSGRARPADMLIRGGGGAEAVSSAASGSSLPPKLMHPLTNDRRILAPLHCDSSFTMTPLSVSGYEGYSVNLLPPPPASSARHGLGPTGWAIVHHLWPSTAEGYRDADELLEGYQGAEAGKLFTRNRLSTHKAAGSLLCQQFTFNAGERYNHAIEAHTYPFEPPASSHTSLSTSSTFSTTYAPACTKRARDYLQGTVQRVVGKGHGTEMNEILSVAYMVGGKMNYHDDGERGLGPYVASISLGSDALMLFRSKTTKGKPGKKAEQDAAVSVASEAGKKGKAPTSLKVKLKHGDLLIMEGPDMQKLFEHSVIPEGLRFAATARYIGPDHLNPPAHKTAAYGSGFAACQPIPSRFAYQDGAPASTLPTADKLPPLPEEQEQSYPLQHIYEVPKKKVQPMACGSGYTRQEVHSTGTEPSQPPSAFSPWPVSSYPHFPRQFPAASSHLHRDHAQREALSPSLAQNVTSAPRPRARVVPPPPPPYHPGIVYTSSHAWSVSTLKQRAQVGGSVIPQNATLIVPADPDPHHTSYASAQASCQSASTAHKMWSYLRGTHAVAQALFGG
ncbi:hypothetical protein JCM11251_004499 [Rhodosporidiobolus azoricus]